MNEQTTNAAQPGSLAELAQTAAKATKAKKAAKPVAKGKTAKAPAKGKTAAKAKPVAKGKAAVKAKAPAKKAAPKGEGHKSTDALKEAAKTYHRTKEQKTASGNASVDCGDQVAAKLRGMDLTAVYSLAAKTLDITVKELQAKYGHLNTGMQRMNLGNRIRGAVNAK